MSDAAGVSSAPAWEQLAREAAQRPAAAASARRCELVGIRLGEDAYALPIEPVREIVRLRPITPIPRAPQAVRGVIALRGDMLQVVDLGRRLGLAPVEPGRASRIVVVRRGDGGLAGILVDAVTEVLRVTDAALRPPPPGESDAVATLCERDGAFVSVIDLDRALDLGHER